MKSFSFTSVPDAARLRLYGWLALAFALAAFLFIGGAMACYAAPYRFFEEFLSEMGRTAIRNGAVGNLPACLLFNAGLVTAGIGTGGYFILRGRAARKIIGIPVVFCGAAGGILLAVTGLIPLDCWEAGHNASVDTGAILISAALVLCGVEGDGAFSSRENNGSWLFMTAFTAVCWFVLESFARYQPGVSGCCSVLQQKIMVFFLWVFMIRHALLLLQKTRRKNPEKFLSGK